MTGLQNSKYKLFFEFLVSLIYRPEGFVSLEREDGSLREGFCLDGKWDGMVREFDEDRVIKVIRNCDEFVV